AGVADGNGPVRRSTRKSRLKGSAHGRLQSEEVRESRGAAVGRVGENVVDCLEDVSRSRKGGAEGLRGDGGIRRRGVAEERGAVGRGGTGVVDAGCQDIGERVDLAGLRGGGN